MAAKRKPAELQRRAEQMTNTELVRVLDIVTDELHYRIQNYTRARLTDEAARDALMLYDQVQAILARCSHGCGSHYHRDGSFRHGLVDLRRELTNARLDAMRDEIDPELEMPLIDDEDDEEER